jgi:hypothetical protein
MASGQAHDHGHSDGHHHGHSHGHAHNHAAGASERGLKIALGLTGAYLVAEVVGGLLTGSLALLSTPRTCSPTWPRSPSRWSPCALPGGPPTKSAPFGYYRFEILAAAVNAAVLFLVGFYILYEAWQRFQQPPEIETGWMLGVATLGLIVNLLSMRALQAGSQQSLNMKGAYLEVWSDALGSVAVIVGRARDSLHGLVAGGPDPGRADRPVGVAANVVAAERKRQHFAGRRARGPEPARNRGRTARRSRRAGRA